MMSKRRALSNAKIGRYLTKYGITEEDKLSILTFQGGRCTICKTNSPTTAKGDPAGWVVDHCHRYEKETGKIKIRGIICSRCNTLLGMAQDDPDVLVAAIEYLRKAEKQEDSWPFTMLSLSRNWK